MNLRKPGFHQPDKLIEEIDAVVGSWRSLRMVLDAEHRSLSMDQTLHRSVIEIEVGQAEVRSTRDFLVLTRKDGKPVVLRRDLDRVAIEVAHGVVRPVVAKRKLVGLRSERPSDQLVAQTDSEDRNAPFGQTEYGPLRLLHGRGIARAV